MFSALNKKYDEQIREYWETHHSDDLAPADGEGKAAEDAAAHGGAPVVGQ